MTAIEPRLVTEFRRLGREHAHALQSRAARVVLGASVTRVFVKETKEDLFKALSAVPVSAIRSVRTDRQFKAWFEQQLTVVHRAISKRNRTNKRILPGARWGHASKVLTIFVREVVSHSSLLTDKERHRLEPFLFVPLDSINIKRLHKLGVRLPFSLIREIDTAEKFYKVQDLLGRAAASVGVPRVWFDDNWAAREE
jgi:hypothetical protein